MTKERPTLLFISRAGISGKEASFFLDFSTGFFSTWRGASPIIRCALSLILIMKEGLPMVARIIGGFLGLFFGGLVLASAIGAQTVKVGITSKTLFFMPYYVGQKKGFYAAENIRIEPVLIGRSDVQLAALLAGEIQFGSLNADATIVINEKGGNLKVIAGVDNSAPYILVGGKAYKKIDDLKGARIGVSALRGGATSILLDYLKSKGLL